MSDNGDPTERAGSLSSARGDHAGIGIDVAACRVARVDWCFARAPIFRKLLEAGIDECFVLVAPIEALRSRQAQRIGENEEPWLPQTPYDGAYWTSLLDRIDYFHVYDQLLDVLDEQRLSYKVVLSAQGRFTDVRRASLRAHLKGDG